MIICNVRKPSKMKTKHTYTTPASETLELKPQGMLCGSGETQVFWFLSDSFSGTKDNYEEQQVTW